MTLNLSGRKILNDGTVICEKNTIVEMLYEGKNISGVILNDELEVSDFEYGNRICDSNIPGPIYSNGEIYSNINWNDHWMTPEPYLNIDLKEWCHSKCNTNDEHDRVNIEIEEFTKRKMIPIMKHLIYCVDVWRQNNIFWGVGRGSSVSSFVLYLIGINRVNPLKYNLDLAEWLK